MAGSIVELTAVVDDLRIRLERLEAERDILRIVHSYGPALDHGNDADWVACFTPDGVWETTGVGARQAHVRRGADELREFAVQHTSAPDHQHLHCVFGTRIDVDLSVGTADAVSYFARLDGLDTGPVILAIGRYHDQFENGPGGWRIAHRRAEITSRVQQPA